MLSFNISSGRIEFSSSELGNTGIFQLSFVKNLLASTF